VPASLLKQPPELPPNAAVPQAKRFSCHHASVAPQPGSERAHRSVMGARHLHSTSRKPTPLPRCPSADKALAPHRRCRVPRAGGCSAGVPHASSHSPLPGCPQGGSRGGYRARTALSGEVTQPRRQPGLHRLLGCLLTSVHHPRAEHPRVASPQRRPRCPLPLV